jgi:hypothetical protein
MWVFSKIAGVELKQLFLRAFANLFEVLSSKCKSSPAHEYIEKCEETFYHNKLVDTDDLLTSVRWNIQSPIGENALILTYDLDSIMNLISIFQGKDDEVYENGKTYTRYSIYNLCKPDKMLYKDYILKLRQSNFINCVKKQYSNLTEEQISELSEKVDFSDTHKYLKYRVMHSMIDLTLSFLMECDNIALDKQRREDLSRLTRSVKDKIGVVDDDKVVDFLKKKGFDEEFAQNKLLPQIKTVIEALDKCDNEQCKLIVDNWHLSKEMHDLIERKEGVLHNLNSFCEDNMCIFVGLKRGYLGIEKDKPFKISELNGKHSVEYCDYSQGNVNALAKCALTTVVDGSKGRGFDSEYNHVASIFTDSASQFNDPAEALQNLGRNRERNTSRQSWFFAAAGEKVELFVDKVLAKLKSPPRYFCQKVLFPAVDRYSKLVKNRMGVELGAKMEIYISENMDALGNINDKDLQDFSYGLIKEAYEKVHDMNDFDVEKTEKDLRKIAKSTEEYLRSYRNRIINDGKPLFLQRVLFFVLTTITKAAYYVNFAFDYVIFLAKSCTLNEKDDEKVLAYAYVIRHCSLESFLKCSSIISKHGELLLEKVEKLQKKYTLKEPLELLTNGLQNAGEKERLVKLLETAVGLLENENYIEALDKSIYSLLSTKEGKKCLSTILNTIYSQDNNNDNKLKKIIDFKKNLSEFSNFLKNIKNSSLEDLEQVYKWICEINQEIINCQAYYHNINTLFGFGEPKLKTDHPLFNIRTVYNKETFTNSYGKLHNSHSKLLFFAKFNYMARYVVVISLPLLPLALTNSLIAQVISFLVVSAMLLMDYNYPEASRGLIFCANIQNDSRSAVNELDLLSKQFEVECVDKVANDIPVHLSSILTQQISSGVEKTVYT